MATVGALLIYLECNRPGRVLPGSLGVLLLLLGARDLALLPLRPAGLWCLALAAVLLASLAISARGEFARMLGGTGLLAAGLMALPARAPRWWFLAAGCCGLLLGTLTAWLARVARIARHSKRGHAGASADVQHRGVAERWGVN